MFNFINTWYKRYFTDPQASLLVILLAFGLIIFVTMGKMLAPLLAALIIAYLLEGAVSKLQIRDISRFSSVNIVYSLFLVLMALGVALTRLKVVSWTHATILGLVRVILGPIIGFTLIKFLNLSGFMAGVLLIQSAMPSAVLTYLVGSMYSKKRAVDNIASVIVSSTLMSFVTVPIVVYLSLRFFN